MCMWMADNEDECIVSQQAASQCYSADSRLSIKLLSCMQHSHK
jgi:hypothetical protein